MPVIPATQEAQIRRIAVQSQPGQIVCKTLPQNKTFHRVAQGIVPEFKPQCCQRCMPGAEDWTDGQTDRVADLRRGRLGKEVWGDIQL
jgi:hypothetical protein